MTEATTWLLGLLGIVLLLQLSTRLGEWAAGRADRRDAGRVEVPVPDDRSPASRWVSHRRQELARRAACLPLLPEGHRPPPGLGPISPSERFLSAETARGLRELQLFLHDPA